MDNIKNTHSKQLYQSIIASLHTLKESQNQNINAHSINNQKKWKKKKTVISSQVEMSKVPKQQ